MARPAPVRDALFVLMLGLVPLGSAAQVSAVSNGLAPLPIPMASGAPIPASAVQPLPPGAKSRPSPVLAKQISSVLPAWSPPPPNPVVRLPPPDPEVVQMEPVIVWGDRVKLTATDVLTDGAKLEIAEKRYISPLYRVTFGPLSQVAAYYFNFLSVLHGWHPNEAEALTLYRQDERLKMLGALDSLAELETIGGDSKDAKDFQRIRFEAAASSR